MNDKIRAIIVDDEALGRESLKSVLRDFPDIEVVGECADGFEAVQAVQQLKPDLLFLDIQMPRLDGFDVVELLGKETPFIIFVTAYDEYALRAFDAQALDYLLKPVKKERLHKSIERLQGQIQARARESMANLVQKHRRDQAPLGRLLIRDNTQVAIIPVGEIVYIEAQDDYVKIFTQQKTHLKSETLGSLEQKLDPTIFCRIHRSYILNTDFLTAIEPYTKDCRIVKLKNGKTLPLSKTGYDRLLELIH